MAASDNLKKTESNVPEKIINRRLARYIGQFTAEDLAPDGGWGWMVAIGTAVAQIVSLSASGSFGLLFGDFLSQSENPGSALTLVNLMFTVSFSLSGLVCNGLLKRHSFKLVGVLGALIFSTANILTAFVPNISYVAFAFFVQGIGIGLVLSVSNTSLNVYFFRRRAMMMTVLQVIIGFGGIIYPLLIQHLLSTYGFRGCAALLGAISLNAICGMMTIDPVEHHYKMPNYMVKKPCPKSRHEITFDYIKDNIGGDKKMVESTREQLIDVERDWKKNKSVSSLENEAEKDEQLLMEPLKASHKSQERFSSALDHETEFHLGLGKGSSLDLLTNRIAMLTTTSGSSLPCVGAFGDMGHQIVEVEEKKDPVEKKRTIRSILADFFEVALLHDGGYLNICLGMSFSFMSDITFSSFLPMIMAEEGYTKSEVALTLTVTAIAELVSRIFLAVFVMFFQIKARYVFLFAMYALFFFKIGFLYCNSLTSTITVIALCGFARSWYMVPQPLIFAEHFKINRFAAAYGLFTVINGAIALVFCPLIGIVKDMTNSFVAAQCVLLGGNLLCLVPWTIEIWIYEIIPRYKRTKISTCN